MKARLGPLVVDEHKGIVCDGDGGVLPVARKGVELLVHLGRARNKPVRRQLLLRDLWPDRAVGDKALSMLVVETRRQLIGYFGGHDPIQTVAGVGYVLSVGYEPIDTLSILSHAAGEPRGRMRVFVAPPVLLTPGAEAAQVGACWHDSLLNALGGEPGLEVGMQPDPAPDPLSLSIQSSVRMIGRELMLGLRCITSADGRIRWTASERGDVADSFAVETRLCDALRRELQLAGAGYAGRQMWAQYRQSPGFLALTHGQTLISARNPAGLAGARAGFQTALALDPTCAPALVGLAECEILSAFYDDAETAAATERAMAYVERALALNADLATAHATRGFIHLSQFRFADAEQALLKAIGLDGTSAIALQWYADFLATQGRMAEAIQIGHMAVARAPDSPLVHGQLGQLLHMGGAFDEAHAQLQHTLELEPEGAIPHCFLGLNLAIQRQDAAAVEHARRAMEALPNVPFFRGALGGVLAYIGEHERAQQQLHALEASASRIPAYAEAAMLVAAALGQTKRALFWFRAVADRGASWMLYAPALPILRPIRGESEFQALVRGCGMENPHG